MVKGQTFPMVTLVTQDSCGSVYGVRATVHVANSYHYSHHSHGKIAVRLIAHTFIIDSVENGYFSQLLFPILVYRVVKKHPVFTGVQQRYQ